MSLPVFCPALLLPVQLVMMADQVGASATAPPGNDLPRIYGGEVAETCQFPSTVYNSEAGCSGTLVHPQVVIHAGHCGTPSSFVFGEVGRQGARTVATKWCEAEPLQGSDYAICVLEEAVQDVPVAPILQGCEADALQVGTKILLAGFGYANNAEDGPDIGIKRFVEVEINSLNDTEVMLGGMDGKGGCNGDSGGPAFIQLADGSWRTFGSTHGGAEHPDCAEGTWKLTHVAMPWYEEQLAAHGESDIDLSPCFNDSGDWEPTAACGGYAMDVAGPFGAWENGCSEGAPLSPPSATCGPALDNDKPEVEITAPDGDATFDAGELITVKVSATDNLAVVAVELFVDGKSQGSVEQSPYTWELEDLKVGEHELQAKASDAAKNTGESAVVQLEIVEASTDTGETSSTDDDDDDDNDGDDDDDGNATSDDDDDDGSSTASTGDTSDEDDEHDSGEDDDDDDDTSEGDDDNDEDVEDMQDAKGCGGCQAGRAGLSGTWLAALALLISRRRRTK